MTDPPLTCPYCNAQVLLPSGMQPGRRLECPTCGEAFALPATAAVTTSRAAVTGSLAHDPAHATAALPVPDVSQSPETVQRTNRRLAALIVTLMLGMACLGLVFALMTWGERRSHDTGLTQQPKRSPIPIENPLPEVTPLAPDRLPALGYLPDGTDFLVAARVAELRQSTTGKRLLEEPLRFGSQSLKVTDLAHQMGLPLEQIDHVVLGLKLEKVLPPWLTMVIRTSGPYDADQLRRQLRAEKVAHEGKKTLFRFKLPERSVPLIVWFADDHTLVLGIDDSQVEAAPALPRAGLSQLADELQTVLRERRPVAAPLWLAAHSKDWSQTLVRPLLERMAQKSWEKLRQIPTFAAWVDLNGTIRTQVVLHCQDERSARRVHKYLDTLDSSRAGKRTVAREGDWILVQLSTPPDLLQRILEK